jgi:hypothetical protein
MNIRKVVAISGLALLTATPFATHAGAAAKASDACIQAFVDAYLPKDSAVRVRKLGPAPGPLRFYSRQYTIDLSANAGATGAELVTARCVANTSGEVLTLNSTSAVRGRVIPGVVARLK